MLMYMVAEDSNINQYFSQNYPKNFFAQENFWFTNVESAFRDGAGTWILKMFNYQFCFKFHGKSSSL